VKLRAEKAGRGGKMVTVVYDLPRNAAFPRSSVPISSAPTGGTTGDDTVELQGDHRDRLRDVLQRGSS
jgi:translation initiation factor 1